MAVNASRFYPAAVCWASLIGVLGVPLGASPGPECALSAVPRAVVPANVRSADPGMRATLDALAAESGVVRDMLDEIGAASRALVIVRGNPRLPVEAHFHGLSTAGLSEGVLVIQVEVNDQGPADYQRAVLAHELAHVVEFVSLPRLPVRQLAGILMAREGRHMPWSSSMRLETSFAQAIEHAVADELRGHLDPAAGLFLRLSARHGVDLADAGAATVPCGAPILAAR